MAASTFEAIIDDRRVKLTIDDGRVTVDGEQQPYSIIKTGHGSYSLLIDGQSSAVLIDRIRPKRYRVSINGRTRVVQLKNEQDLLLEEMGLEEVAASTEAEVRAPMPGLVLAIHVEVGQNVEPDDGLVVVEAMKMENELRAPAAGRVTAVHVTTGETVDKDQLLIEVEPTDRV